MRNVHSAKAYDFIRKKILSGEYPPGYRLKTQELAPIIGVSGTPVRDALRQLETDSLVVIQPRLGAHVKTLDLAEFKEMSELRCALECLAAEGAAKNRTPAELAEIESALNEMGAIVEKLKTASNDELLAPLRRHDVEFHMAILGAAQNRTLHRELLRLNAIQWVVAPRPGAAGSQPISWRIAVQDNHRRIFEAIKQGDPEAARIAMKEHTQGIADRAILAMAKTVRREQIEREATEELIYSE